MKIPVSYIFFVVIAAITVLVLTSSPPQPQQVPPSVERSVVCKYHYSNDNPPVFHIRCPA